MFMLKFFLTLKKSIVKKDDINKDSKNKIKMEKDRRINIDFGDLSQNIRLIINKTHHSKWVKSLLGISRL